MTLEEFIEEFEGYSEKLYRCPAGLLTIGIGHVVNEKTEDIARWVANGITRAEALKLLRKDIDVAQRAVDRLVDVPLSENQNKALVSFVFNLGAGRLKGSTMRKLLNKAQYKEAADQFLRWVYSDGKKLAGLVRRRAAERELFLS
jgi:GH24 family phage-related lysozyme (muramidase)